ncbi:MAG: VWA domain-containing protein, partial [Pseudomonadota bacterium]
MRKVMLAAAALIGLNLGPATASPPVDDVIDPAVHSYILLDRTGSMSSIWDEALGSVNAYAASVGEAEEGEPDTLKTIVNLAIFDAQDGLQFDVLRRKVEA